MRKRLLDLIEQYATKTFQVLLFQQTQQTFAIFQFEHRFECKSGAIARYVDFRIVLQSFRL